MEAEQAAFSAAITAIRHSALMTFPTEEDQLCVFCDASLSGYSIVVTMVHTWDVTRPVEDQDHSLVISFPIIKICTELEYLLLRLKGFRLYCDHANLINLFLPSMDVQEHVRDRLQPDDEFVFPTLSDIVDAQMVSRGATTSLPVVEEDGVLVVDHKPWIPTRAKDLLARIMMVAHYGSQDYRAEGLIEWYKRYGCPFRLFSDQGVHFLNQTVDYLCSRLKIERTFSPVYTPWLNGTVERVYRDLHQVPRVLLIFYGFDFHEWPYLLPVVQANINHTKMRSLADHSLAELFTGLESPSPLDMIIRPTQRGDEIVIVDLADVEPQLVKLRASLEGLHKEVVDIKERKRLADMQRKTGSVCNFDVGDYVLWSRIDQRLPNNKLLGQWLGHFRIIEALPHAFNIQHLVTNKVYEVHGIRLKYYADTDLNMDAEMRELVTSQGIVLDVAAIVDHRYNQDPHRWGLRVQWVGLQPIEDSWDWITMMRKDVP
ncbi:hypothetical protein PHMEG_00028497, partial [Phytophthora megakarya]